MKNACRLLGLVAMLGFAGVAAADDPLDPDKLAFCMMAHSGPAEETAIKSMIIAALQDDEAGLRAGIAELGGVILRLAVDDCGIGLSQFEDPAFNVAAEKYGEMLGAKVMEAAFAKLQ